MPARPGPGARLLPSALTQAGPGAVPDCPLGTSRGRNCRSDPLQHVVAALQSTRSSSWSARARSPEACPLPDGPPPLPDGPPPPALRDFPGCLVASPPSSRRSGSLTRRLPRTTLSALDRTRVSVPLKFCFLTTGHSGDSTASLPSCFSGVPDAHSEITSRLYSDSLDLQGLPTAYDNKPNRLEEGPGAARLPPAHRTAASAHRARGPGGVFAWNAQFSYLSLGSVRYNLLQGASCVSEETSSSELPQRASGRPSRRRWPPCPPARPPSVFSDTAPASQL